MTVHLESHSTFQKFGQRSANLYVFDYVFWVCFLQPLLPIVGLALFRFDSTLAW